MGQQSEFEVRRRSRFDRARDCNLQVDCVQKVSADCDLFNIQGSSLDQEYVDVLALRFRNQRCERECVTSSAEV